MDYIRQVNGFWNWRRTNEVSHVQMDLYFTLLACANAAFWREPLSIPNTTLFGMCQISKTELHRQRLVLIQKGLIRYSKGKRGTSGTYIINPLYETVVGTYPGTNPAINSATNEPTDLGNLYKKKTKTKTNTTLRDASYDLVELEEMINRPFSVQK